VFYALNFVRLMHKEPRVLRPMQRYLLFPKHSLFWQLLSWRSPILSCESALREIATFVTRKERRLLRHNSAQASHTFCSDAPSLSVCQLSGFFLLCFVARYSVQHAAVALDLCARSICANWGLNCGAVFYR